MKRLMSPKKEQNKAFRQKALKKEIDWHKNISSKEENLVKIKKRNLNVFYVHTAGLADIDTVWKLRKYSARLSSQWAN